MTGTSEGRNKLPRVWLSVVLALAVVVQGALGAFAGAAHAEEAAVAAPTRAQVSEAIGQLQAILAKNEPVSDWTAFALARSGKPVLDRYAKTAANAVADGSLRLVTDYARVTLALNASGGNAQDVGAGHVNLLAKIAGFEKMTAQGANAPAYALLALDAAGYEPGTDAKWTRDALIKWLVDNRNEDGGWSLSGKSDVDVTGIVLTALAPYQDREDVKGAVAGALTWLSAAQLASGGFGSGSETSESTSQVLIALTALGIDPASDARFVKDGVSPAARLLSFKQADGKFAHAVGGQGDAMASFYALLGLTALDRYQDGLPGLFSGIPAAGKATVVVNGLSGTIASGSAIGKTAMETVVNVLKATGTPYTITQSQYGAYLSAVDGVAGGQLGGYDGWNYAVKRDGAWVGGLGGMSAFAVAPGDELVVYYGDMSTVLVHDVTFEPAAPLANQPATAKVEQETYDWDSGKAIVGPAVGAKVAIGGKTAVTDENGEAKFDALPQGALAVTVTGYASGKAPTIVAWSSELNVASYEKKIAVRVEGDAGLVASGTAVGGTASEAVKALLESKGVKYHVASFDWGSYIDSIGGIDAAKYGGYDGWSFAVVRGGKWMLPSVGADAFLLEDGDEVVFYYGGEATQVADPIKLSVSQPQPGQDLQVTVSSRAWNWEKNAFDPAQPVANATVKAGGVQAVTDASGKATLKGLKAGFYALEATGYAKDAAPSFVRAVTPVAVTASYADQKSVASWAQESVRIAKASGVLLAPGNAATGSFKPQQATTRAEFVSAIVRSLGLKATGGASGFGDVPAKAWYAADIATAAKAGLISGVTKTSFAPDATLTREQAAMVLTRALKLQTAGQTALKDEKQASAVAVASIQAVLENGWMTAYAGKFSPKAQLTREQAAVIAARIVVANQVK